MNRRSQLVPKTETAGTAASLLRQLRRLGNPVQAAGAARFFKSAPGQYGAGDRFLGIRVPVLRQLARDHEALSLDEARVLLGSEWHEARLLALLILVRRYRRTTDAEREAIHNLYMSELAHVNNWDLVDSSAECLVGAHLGPKDRGVLTRLAKSSVLWERRVAMIATFHGIRRGEPGEALRIATLLLGDPHDLIHKAVGWMLREAGKRDEAVLRQFLDRHAASMPRTALRYAIERFPAALRKHYMTRPSPAG